MAYSRVLSLLTSLFVCAPSVLLGDEPPIQADVYDALFDAYVQCDDDLKQSRSEFITDMLERDSGNGMSMEMLRNLFTRNVQAAKQAIVDKAKERELYVSEMLRLPRVSSDESVEEANASAERHEKIRQIDYLVKREKRYIKVHECVLSVL